MLKQSHGCSQLWRSLCYTALLLAIAQPVQSFDEQPANEIVPLTPGSRPEGVTAGSSNDLWVACLSGRVLHVDLVTNTTTVVHQEPGVALSGAKFCPKQQILFAAGSLSGNGYVIHMQRANRSSRSSSAGPQQYIVAKREVIKLYSKPGLAYINDVALSDDNVFFTDSFHPVIYSISRNQTGSNDGSVVRYNTGSYFDTKLGQFRANGLAVHASSEGTDTLLVANTHTGNLYRVVFRNSGTTRHPGQTLHASKQQSHDPATATASVSPQPHSLSAQIFNVTAEVESRAHDVVAAGQQHATVHELVLPKVPGKVSDTLLLDGVWIYNSSLAFVTDNFNNRVWGVEISGGLASARLVCLIQLPVFKVPTTISALDGKLWVTNAHLDTCFPFLPCPHHAFEVLGIDVAQCQPWP